MTVLPPACLRAGNGKPGVRCRARRCPGDNPFFTDEPRKNRLADTPRSFSPLWLPALWLAYSETGEFRFDRLFAFRARPVLDRHRAARLEGIAKAANRVD